MSEKKSKIRVAIAGANGFVGEMLLKNIPVDWNVVALSRNQVIPKKSNSDFVEEQVQWRSVDLFSLHSAISALEGVDVAIYLVHSMLPSTRLFQGGFADTDLLIADNFANACLANGVKQIVYLGGLVPEEKISKHLASRQEVEDVFKATGIPYTILRAGMIAGNGGSSFEILRNLVRNLPAMVLPRWTQVGTQVIYIDDLVRVLSFAVSNPDLMNQTIDVVNGEKLNYEILIRTACYRMGKRPLLLPVPINSTAFSKLWVSFFGRTNYDLVSPLIDSLLCELPQKPPLAKIEKLIQVRTFDEMLKSILAIPRAKRKKSSRSIVENSVRSIQRLPALPSLNCEQIAEKYKIWLPNAMFGIIRVVENKTENTVSFNLWGIRRPLLVLRPVENDVKSVQRAKFHIVGGVLAKHADCGWLEFRQISNKQYTLAAIHDFVPTLPWYIYRFTQAIMHKRVMLAFAKSLRLN